MTVIERSEPERPHKNDPPCTCGSTAGIDANRHDWRCARRLWIERNDSRGAVDDLREVARLLDRSTRIGRGPTEYEWAALALANATLDRLGGCNP